MEKMAERDVEGEIWDGWMSVSASFADPPMRRTTRPRMQPEHGRKQQWRSRDKKDPIPHRGPEDVDAGPGNVPREGDARKQMLAEQSRRASLHDEPPPNEDTQRIFLTLAFRLMYTPTAQCQ